MVCFDALLLLYIDGNVQVFCILKLTFVNH